MPTRQPPPNYLARSFQLKILSLIAALALVWALMSAAKNPENWEWFFRLGRGSLGVRHVETRYRPEQNQAEEPLLKAGEEDEKSVAALLPANASLDERAWARILEDLDVPARSMLLIVLRDATRGRPAALTAEQRERLLSDLDRAWSAISVSDLIPPGGAAAPGIDLEKWWGEWRDALAPSIEGRPVDAEHRSRLARLQTILHRIACRSIRNNTPFRSAERFAWELMLANLQASTNERLAADSVGEVSFLQLFDQPEVYQCKIVTIEGFARRYERVPSREHLLGITQLYRMWIKPADGTDAPFVVYCLDLPEGLPKPTQSQPAIDRDIPGDFVTIHGFYYKRWLYQGADRSAFLAPLILARTPEFEPPAEPNQPASSSDPWTVLWGSAAIASVFAILFTWWVWRFRPQAADPPSIRRLRELRGDLGESDDSDAIH